MKKHTQTLTGVVFSLSLFSASPLLAAEEAHQSYGAKVGCKATNGLANMVTAPLEIPKNMINTVNDSNIVYGTIGGLAKGILNTVGRITSGATDFVTAPIPTKPIVKPRYIWQDFDADTTYDDAFRLQN